MRSSFHSIHQLVIALALMLSVASGQGLDSIPQCYQNCIKNSGDFTCNGFDIPCICRLSNGNYLTDVINCIKSSCDNTLNTNDLLGPLQLGCNLVGVPIASAAIANAQNAASSTTASGTTTGKLTVTSTFASAGTTFVVAAPISVSSGQSGFTTSTGQKSTSTVSSSNGGTAAGSGSAPSSTSSNSGSSTSSTATGAAASSSTSSTTSTTQTTSTTSTTTSSAQSSASSAAAKATSNGGSPFANNAQTAEHKSSMWLGFWLVLAGATWF